MVVFDFDHLLSLFMIFPFFHTYFLAFVQLLDGFGTMVFVISLAMLVFHSIHISAGGYPSFVSIKIYLRCISISYYLCVSIRGRLALLYAHTHTYIWIEYWVLRFSHSRQGVQG